MRHCKNCRFFKVFAFQCINFIFQEFMLYSCHKEVYQMIDTHELKKRDLYLNKIIAFQDTEPVKVVTGIRRCGKSSLLKLMTLHLKRNWYY